MFQAHFPCVASKCLKSIRCIELVEDLVLLHKQIAQLRDLRWRTAETRICLIFLCFHVFCFLLFRNTLIILDSSSWRRFLNTKMNKSVFQQKCLTQVFCFKVLQRISGGHLSFQFLAVDVLLNFQVQKHICILLISVDSTATGLISLYICIRFV